MKFKKYKALIFAPKPPPTGGIASITSMLSEDMDFQKDVLFKNPVVKNDSIEMNFSRALKNLYILFSATLKIPSGKRVLFFSSAGFSFIEKLFWTYVVILLGRKVAIVMVDGNFPRYYQKRHPLLKKALNFLITNSRITLGSQSLEWSKYYKNIFPYARIKEISASVDKQFFQTDVIAKNEKNGKLNIIYIGWIIHDKGIMDLLDAIDLIKNDLKNLQFRLIGNYFSKGKYWKAKLKERNLEGFVHLVGALTSRDQILREYKNADIFVFPSHYEGFPVALLEALVIGLPCIATNVGGAPDILDHGRAGMLVNSKAPGELADAILTMASEESLRTDYSRIALERGRTSYDFNNLIISYREILELDA